MKKNIKISIFLYFIITVICFANEKLDGPNPIDKDVSVQTKNLFLNLLNLSKNKILFGHQNSFKEGKGWKFNGTPDIKQVSNFYPSVVGFDFRDIMKRPSFYIPFYREKIKDFHSKGGIITFSWHMENPATGGSFYDKTPAIKKILPGGSKHSEFKSRLDKFANFAKGLRDDQGRHIPIIFRPWHEHNGNWFWWSFSEDDCHTFCWWPGVRRYYEKLSSANFIKLWRFTVTYLSQVKGVHNLLYAYSPGVIEKREYLWRYPGDKFVDILGLDQYMPSTRDFLSSIKDIVIIAKERGKIAALTETGDEGVPNSRYWTDELIGPIKRDFIASNISYVLVWRNSGDDDDHFFAPYPGHNSSDNFVEMVRDPFVLMLGEQDKNIYSEP